MNLYIVDFLAPFIMFKVICFADVAMESKMNKLNIRVPNSVTSYVSDFLLGIGAQGVSEEDSENEMSLISALFTMNTEIETVITEIGKFKAILEDIEPGITDFQISYEQIGSSDWEIWKKMLRTVRITPNLVIHPPWEEYEPRGTEISIEINPSLAFGTGHHETTRGCIKAIEEICSSNDIKSVIDVGCGSGILGIVAARLGVPEVVCFDTDFVAIRETVSNLSRNDTLESVKYFCGTIDNIPFIKADIVVANISFFPISEMKNKLISAMKENSFLILSGITLSSIPDLDQLFNSEPTSELDRKVEGEWLTLILKN